jgi:thiamine biosynthesis lipoprotein
MTSDSEVQTRRQFLRQQLAPVALAGLGIAGLKPRHREKPEEPAQGELVSLSRVAMACRWEIMLPAEDEAALSAAQAALELVGDLERQMSVFRDDSEISAINRRAAREPVEVEAGLFALLEFALRLNRETSGAFDISAGTLARLWRACRNEGRAPTKHEVELARAACGMDHVRFDHDARTVEFARDGVLLDLGAIGKGYALDRVCASLRSADVTRALVHAGHSSIAAVGSPPWDSAWTVSVADALGGEHATPLRLRDRCMATSGSSEQFYEVGGKRYGHIIDPRTGWPAEGALSATVIAADAAQADAVSTAFYIMGAEAAEAYCMAHPDIACLMATTDGPGGAPQVLTFGIEHDVPEVTA